MFRLAYMLIFLGVPLLGVSNQNTVGENSDFLFATNTSQTAGLSNSATVTTNHQYRKSHIGCRMSIGIGELGDLEIQCAHL